MENFIVYIVKASALSAIFLLAYHAFLKKETFFNSNRRFLLTGLVTSALLPFVVYKKVVWTDPAPVPVYESVDLQKMVMLQQAQIPAAPEFTIDWFAVITILYMAGVLFFLTRFAIDLLSLRRVIKRQAIVKEDGFLMVDSPNIKSPFSFFNYIVFNSAALKPDELDNIICHEKVHSSQKHSADMIIGQLFCIAFWFNPFAWLYKKSISQNLEFIADAEATKIIADKQAYQKTLLKITVQPECIAITNHFYQSLIKKRIVMLNKQQSKKSSSWKYAIVLPALVAFMLIFQVQTIAQEKESAKPQTIQTKTKISVEVTKDSGDDELQADKKIIKEQFGTDVNFENIKRNQNKEITAIKVTVTDKGQSQHYEVSGNNPISPFTIQVEKDHLGNSSINFGTGAGKGRVIANAFVIHGDQNDSVRSTDKRLMRLGRMDPGTMPGASGVLQPEGHWSVNSMKIGNDDMLIIVDGIKQKKGEAAIKIPLGYEIDEMNILKGKDAKKKYGKEAKDGAVEITTKKEAKRMTQHLRSYRNVIPEMNEHFDFNFEIPDMEVMKFNLGDLEDFEGIFEDGKFISSETLTPEERQKIREEMQRVSEEMQKVNEKFRDKSKSPGYNKMWEGTNEKLRNSRDASSEEIEQAKKEMEQAKKELQEARKELEKARMQLNKKV